MQEVFIYLDVSLKFLWYRYQLVIIKSYSRLHAVVPLLYAPANSLVQFSILVCSLVCRTKRGGAYQKFFVVGFFARNFFFELAFLTQGLNTSSW